MRKCRIVERRYSQLNIQLNILELFLLSSQVRLWARPEALDQTNLALDGATKVLDHFEKYYDIPYALEKEG